MEKEDIADESQKERGQVHFPVSARCVQGQFHKWRSESLAKVSDSDPVLPVLPTQDLKNQGRTLLPIGTVRYNGAAANAQEAANLVKAIGDKDGMVYQSTHPTDIVGAWLGGNPATGEKNNGSFPGSHSSYTGYLPLPNVSVGKVGNLRDVADKNWGTGNYSVPRHVPAAPPKSTKPKKDSGQDE